MRWPERLSKRDRSEIIGASTYRRQARLWLIWFVASASCWILLGSLMFRLKLLPDDNLLLLISFIAATVLSIVALLYAVAKFAASVALR